MGDSFPEKFGPYLLLRVLGVGGQGDVYLALTDEAGTERRLCVVKRLARDSTSEEKERFRREASLGLKLSHRAIVGTIAVSEIAGETVIAQEFLHGCTLANVMATCLRQRIDIPTTLAIHIVREIGSALSYAHAQGTIHRDIAPDNVMLTFSGEVRLLDFGIARTMNEARLTRPGWSVGREAYAAPEVLAGGGGDARSDIYSAGVLLWQLLARRPPPVKERFLPPSSLNRDVSADIDAAVLRAVERDPKDRYQCADDFSEALGQHLPSGDSEETQISTFLARHYDVAREGTVVDQEIARGRAFLETRLAPIPASDSHPVEKAEYKGSRRRWRLVLGATAALMVAAAFLALRVRSSHPGATDQVSLHPSARATTAAALPRDPKETATHPPSPTITAPIPTRRSPETSPRRKGRSIHSAQTDEPVRSVAGVLSPDEMVADGQRRFDTGDIDGALQSARAAIRAGAAGAGAHLLAGRALTKQNQLAEAERELTIAARFDPGNRLAAQRLGELRERIRSPPVPPP